MTTLQTERERRSIDSLLRPLQTLARDSLHLFGNPGAHFEFERERYEFPRFLFVGPRGGDETLRIGLFAAIHGNETEGAYGVIEFLRLLEQRPEYARGCSLFIYPLCNPTGFEDNTRHSRSGHDLNSHFWSNADLPEIQLLESELMAHRFHGIVTLHSSDESGMNGFVHGATLSKHLLEPALQAASAALPSAHAGVETGSKGGLLKPRPGMLSAPTQIRPKPFEIALAAPRSAPQYAQGSAFALALLAILTEYRQLIAYAANV